MWSLEALQDPNSFLFFFLLAEVGNHPIELRRIHSSPRGPSGLLRIFRDGRWGTVCNSSWTLENAQVVCRQLGYSSVVSYMEGYYGRGPIYLSNVRCKGTEQRLDECPHDGWGVHNGCTHVMDVGMECGSAAVSGEFSS